MSSEIRKPIAAPNQLLQYAAVDVEDKKIVRFVDVDTDRYRLPAEAAKHLLREELDAGAVLFLRVGYTPNQKYYT